MSTIKGITPANKELRTVSKEVMAFAAERLPNDSFMLSSDVLGQDYVVVDVRPTTFQGRKGFIVVGKNSDRTVHLHSSTFVASRILGKADVKADSIKTFNDNKRIFMRGDAEAIWAGSTYYHGSGDQKMSPDKSFEVPVKFRLEYAIVKEDQQKAPRLRPSLYKGFDTVVAHYNANNIEFTWAAFLAELAKKEDRIPGLPKGVHKLEAKDDVDETSLRAITYNLILADTVEPVSE